MRPRHYASPVLRLQRRQPHVTGARSNHSGWCSASTHHKVRPREGCREGARKPINPRPQGKASKTQYTPPLPQHHPRRTISWGDVWDKMEMLGPVPEKRSFFNLNGLALGESLRVS